ncbi:peptide/nickel transport system ATP-binding protein [Pseudochelatococcus lubricantis]|uniref:Peptide/nickel transport system ATP-binding protein n=1 Tax=Pseudochelatococcus lubricantis TaxID=1538102 RepID=A0ABX0V4F5_9HYPH|nr:ABC transporter ATP-binding protein [Pseudochelatococcus lubricantis]NIJ58959.1 peptide/nickel transport system ATP-binding protein [Pseudochelatococcus lubricantis]
MAQTEQPVLDVRNLRLRFPGPGGETTAVSGLSFSVRPGEAVALVGESGCGKSSTALAIMQLLPDTAKLGGEIRVDGRDVIGLPRKELRALRGSKVAMIFQEPMTSLNPVHRVGEQIVEALRAHKPLSREDARERALALLEQVRIPDAQQRLDAYPHQLSGGQRQRVMIAMAIACEPRLLIADEPTTALDATIQAQILQLLDDLRRELNMGLLLITHDLALVSRWTENVVVMHHGEKMEQLAAADLFGRAHHPYTRGLIGASIRLDRSQHYRTQRLPEIRVVHNADDTYEFLLEKREPIRLPPPDRGGAPVVEVHNLAVRYDTPRGPFTAVDDVSLAIAPGETLGLVGESGSGKSTLSKAIMRLVPAHSGRIVFRGEDITRIEGKNLRRVRRNMQMVFQDPYGSLNPRHTVGEILEGPLAVHEVNDARERQKRVQRMLDQVGLPARSANRLPHEFSGGQRQRIGIARALMLNPSLVVCDEPVSALDVSVQSQILNLLVELKESLNLSYLFISHDLAVVQYISDRVIVMKDAKVVEENDHLRIWTHPRHDYTRALISAAAREA